MKTLIYLFIALPSLSFAQDTTTHRLLNQISNILTARENIDDTWRNERQWNLKLSPFHLAVGDIGLYYEQRLGRMTSLELGAGATISEIDSPFNNEPDPGIYYNNPYMDQIWYNPQQRVSRAGYLASLEFRIYPSQNMGAMRGFYISPAVKYKHYNFEIQPYVNDLENYKGKEQNFNAYKNGGLEKWPSKFFVLDIFFGLGMGYQVTESAFVNGIYTEFENQYFWDRQSSASTLFLINTGVKLGFGGGKKSKG